MTDVAKIKNETGEDRILPWLHDRLVIAGQVVEVPLSDVYAYTQQDGWTPADDAAKQAHKGAEGDEPAGNASRDEWAAYATLRGATDAELADLTRDEIRDTYSTKEN